jgi:hypothetical protein
MRKTGYGQAGFLILCFLVSAAIALAVPKANGNGKGKDKAQQSAVKEPEKQNHGEDNHATGNHNESSHLHGEILWRQGDRDHIVHYLSKYHGSLPPGLAKRNGDLPPGLEKQLKRNGHLPPGLEKKLQPFPVELERMLPPLEPGLKRGFLGMSAVILNPKTSVIFDIFALK